MTNEHINLNEVTFSDLEKIAKRCGLKFNDVFAVLKVTVDKNY